MRKKLSVAVRMSVLARAAPPCEVCLEPTSLSRFSDVGRRVGQFAHIRAVSLGGPRFDPAHPPAELDEPENLFWCCSDCHQIVDHEAWPLERLQATVTKNRAMGRTAELTIEGEINVVGEFAENVTGVDAGGMSTTLKPGTKINVHGIGSRNVTGVKT